MSSSLLLDMRYQRTRSPFFMVSIGRLPSIKPLMLYMRYSWRKPGSLIFRRVVAGRDVTLDSKYALAVSSKMASAVTNSRSTSLGRPSGWVEPLLPMMIGPMSPVLVSFGSTKWEWYIQRMELESPGAGPARGGTVHVYVCDLPGGSTSSAFSASEVPSL